MHQAILKLVTAIFLVFILSACTFTGTRGLYSELQLSDNIYRIEIAGRSSTPHQTVKNFALLRAAELTLNAGKKRFVILEDNIERVTTETVYDNDFMNDPTSPTYTPPQTTITTKSSGTLTIEMIDAGDKRYSSAYDAKLIAEQLRPILMPEGSDDWALN